MKEKLFDRFAEPQFLIAVFLLVVGFTYLKFGHPTDSNANRTYDLMFLACTFYFGTNKSSTTKDQTILTQAQNNPNPPNP